MAKGRGLYRRSALLERIGELDRALYEELLVLRHYNPPAYRKRITRYSRKLGLALLPQEPGTSGKDLVVVDAADQGAPPPPAPEEAGPDLDVLSGSVAAVKKALGTGEHDQWLQELLEAEQAGKARKGVLAALDKRLARA